MATLLDSLKSQEKSNIHELHVNVKDGNRIKAVAPSKKVYFFVAEAFVADVDKGLIEIVKEDEKSGIITFTRKSTLPSFMTA